ncbi:MAG: NADH-quinone oxidoreductase subunit N [Bacteroidota bacterium]|nr:NADH-quinone oxidoreductase subunit N [Bacteroidota bacterium]
MNAILILTVTVLAILFAGVYQQKKLVLPLLILGLLGAMATLLGEWNLNAAEGISSDTILTPVFKALHIQSPNSPIITRYMKGMMQFDNYAILFSVAMMICTLFVFFIAREYFIEDSPIISDVYALIVCTLIGGIMMVSYNHLAILFIGIETLSIALYILAGSNRMDLKSNEASIKYFLLGSFSSAFLLMGIAFIYGATGQMELEGIRSYIANSSNTPGYEFPIIFNSGVVLVLIGLLFKTSAAPFHFWAPDVYEGSPTLITTFMGSVVKIAAFGALLRILYVAFDMGSFTTQNILFFVSGLTLLVGNLSAVFQKSVKRMLAYSGVSNAGFMLLALASVNTNTPAYIFYYVLVYALGTILAFGVQMVVSKQVQTDDFNGLHGLATRNPLLTGLMTIAMLSLAGIPPTAGFFGKFLVFKNAIQVDNLTSQSAFHYLIIFAIINAVIGVYYYIRVIAAMFTNTVERASIKTSVQYRVALIAVAVLIILFGLYPNQLVNPLMDASIFQLSAN